MTLGRNTVLSHHAVVMSTSAYTLVNAEVSVNKLHAYRYKGENEV